MRTDRRLFEGLVVGGVIAASPALATPLGRLGSPFALLVALPVLAVALEAFGWSGAAASTIARIRNPVARLVGSYAVWAGTSAVLTLDVAAAAGATVGVAAAGERTAARRWHLGAAMLGSNAGSMLFPFSNLTNLVVLGATGIGLDAFVTTAWPPQVAAALAIGALLALRAHRSGDLGERVPDGARPSGVARPARPEPAAGLVAAAGAAGAIAGGLAGLDMAVPFAWSAAILAGAAVAGGRTSVRQVAGSLPVVALAVVAVAAVLGGTIAGLAALVPSPRDDVAGLALAVGVGALLAVSLNNLPAAAFGAAWLGHAAAPIVVAYLVGTNIAAIATPHGSAATMLVRSSGGRRGIEMPVLAHLRGAWRYALVGSAVAITVLAIAR